MWGGREDCAVGDDGDEPTLLEKDAETETIERERERESEEEEEIKKGKEKREEVSASTNHEVAFNSFLTGFRRCRDL